MKQLPLLIATLGLLLPAGTIATTAQAEEFRGVAKFRGAVNNRAHVTIVKARMRARFMRSSQGNEAHANITARFQRIPEDTVLGSYPGTMRTAVNRDGVVSRDLKETTVLLRRRAAVFENGRIRLSRPIRPTKEGRQRLRGSGRIKVEG